MGPLFFAFVLLPLADLWLLIRIGRVIGGLNVVTFTLCMGLLGALLVRTQGRKVLAAFREAQAQGRVPEEGVVGGLLVLVGGLLLITPGVISDVLGFFCLFPPTRRAIGRALAERVTRKVSQGQLHVHVQDFGFVSRSEPRSPGYPQPGSARVANDPRTRSMPRTEDVIDTEGEEL